MTAAEMYVSLDSWTLHGNLQLIIVHYHDRFESY